MPAVKRKAGQPQYEPTASTRAQVVALVACGVPRKQISEYLHIDQKTLSKHFAPEIRGAVQAANAKIATVLYQKALNGDTVSMLFWLKCRGGWKEQTRYELTGPDGKPLNAATPKVANISWADGGPGQPKPPTSSDDHEPELLPEQDFVPRKLTQSAPAEVAEYPSPARSDTMAAEHKKWSSLGSNTPDTSVVLVVDEPLRNAHVHVASADSVCPQCRRLWVNS